MARPDIAVDAAFATIVVAVIGLVGVIVGQGVQLRLGKQKAVGVTLCLLTLDEAGLSGWEGCWKTRE